MYHPQNVTHLNPQESKKKNLMTSREIIWNQLGARKNVNTGQPATIGSASPPVFRVLKGGGNTNRWVKALCTKVRKRCSVNKIFDAVERLVKCQMRTQNRCLAIDDLKKTVTTVNKALPTVIPLVQASLTSYGLQRFLVQVDMGTTMYDVSSYNPQTVEPIPPR